jgi:hypothetical protein
MILRSRDSPVGITTCYRMDGRDSVPSRTRDFSVLHRVDNGFGANPASHLIGTASSFLGVNRPGRESDYSLPFSVEVKK